VETALRTQAEKLGNDNGEEEESEMRPAIKRSVVTVLLSSLSLLAVPSNAQQPAAPAKVTQITGLAGVKNKTNGTLAIENGGLRFVHQKTNVDLAASAIEDVVTGNDSQRLVGGTLGTLTMFAPYESGRFLSLFRTKLDTLTIKYRDADGALHGAIFTMAGGKAEGIKQGIVAAGAHTSIPTPAGPPSPKASDVKEQKP
jgi:hypothetical protein